MSLANTDCTLKQRADVDAYVKYHVSLLQVERGRLEITLLPIPRAICGTRSPSVSGVLPEGMLCILRVNLIRPCLSTRMYLDVVKKATHMTEILASRILCATTTTTKVWSLEV